MKKLITLLNSIFLVLILTLDIFYIIYGGTLLKGVTSFLFVLLAAINLILGIKLKAGNLKFSVFLVIGLIFAMLGDILLNIHFITGAILFAVGHIFFFIAYCQIVKFSFADLLFGTIIFVPSLLIITLVPIFNFGGILMEIVCIAYALIISFMVGKACANFTKQKSGVNLIIMLGSILFFVSDFMLLLNVFGGVGLVADVICLLTYYPAEFLLAHSIIAPVLYKKTEVTNDKK